MNHDVITAPGYSGKSQEKFWKREEPTLQVSKLLKVMLGKVRKTLDLNTFPYC